MNPANSQQAPPAKNTLTFYTIMDMIAYLKIKKYC